MNATAEIGYLASPLWDEVLASRGGRQAEGLTLSRTFTAGSMLQQPTASLLGAITTLFVSESKL